MQAQAIVSVLAVLAAALAGCVAQPAGESQPTSTSTVAPAGAPGASANAVRGDGAAPPGAALVPFALHLQPDLGLAEEPVASEARVALTTPVNGPFTPGYPSWNGALPAEVELAADGVPLTFYVTTNTASFQANTLPLFPLPGFFLGLRVGDLTASAEVDGPPAMTAGEVYEVTAVLTGDAGRAAAGEPVELTIEVIYSHVAVAAEFQYALGPDHPARLGFNGAA